MRMRTPVFVYADDPVIQAGLEQLLRTRPEIRVVAQAEIDSAEVAVIGTDEIDEAAIRTVRGIQRNGCPRILVVSAALDDGAIVAASEAGVLGLLRRAETTPERLVSTVAGVAEGRACIPADLVGNLMQLVGQLRPEPEPAGGASHGTLSAREQEVLRLVADGHDTSEIATTLCYSERTVKGVIHEITSRLHLKNRSHAVAFALRNEMI